MFDTQKKSFLNERIKRNQVIDDYSFKEKFYKVLDKQVGRYSDSKNFKMLRTFKNLAESFDENEKNKDFQLNVDVHSSFDGYLAKVKTD